MTTKQKDMQIPFGKFRGHLIADVPNSYLKWLIGEGVENFPELKAQIEIELKYRKDYDIYIKG